MRKTPTPSTGGNSRSSLLRRTVAYHNTQLSAPLLSSGCCIYIEMKARERYPPLRTGQPSCARRAEACCSRRAKRCGERSIGRSQHCRVRRHTQGRRPNALRYSTFHSHLLVSTSAAPLMRPRPRGQPDNNPRLFKPKFSRRKQRVAKQGSRSCFARLLRPPTGWPAGLRR